MSTWALSWICLCRCGYDLLAFLPEQEILALPVPHCPGVPRYSRSCIRRTCYVNSKHDALYVQYFAFDYCSSKTNLPMVQSSQISVLLLLVPTMIILAAVESNIVYLVLLPIPLFLLRAIRNCSSTGFTRTAELTMLALLLCMSAPILLQVITSFLDNSSQPALKMSALDFSLLRTLPGPFLLAPGMVPERLAVLRWSILAAILRITVYAVSTAETDSIGPCLFSVVRGYSPVFVPDVNLSLNCFHRRCV